MTPDRVYVTSSSPQGWCRTSCVNAELPIKIAATKAHPLMRSGPLIGRERDLAQAELDRRAAGTTARPAARNLGKAMEAARPRLRHPFSTGLPRRFGIVPINMLCFFAASIDQDKAQ
jgi:hypothetical protein